MRSGRLDRRLQLQTKGATSGFDPTSGTWTTQVTVWGELLDAKGMESFVGQQFAAVASQAYRIRYRTDVNPTWRVQVGAEVWKIVATPEVGRLRRREMLLVVERFNPNDTSS